MTVTVAASILTVIVTVSQTVAIIATVTVTVTVTVTPSLPPHSPVGPTDDDDDGLDWIDVLVRGDAAAAPFSTTIVAADCGTAIVATGSDVIAGGDGAGMMAVDETDPAVRLNEQVH